MSGLEEGATLTACAMGAHHVGTRRPMPVPSNAHALGPSTVGLPAFNIYRSDQKSTAVRESLVHRRQD